MIERQYYQIPNSPTRKNYGQATVHPQNVRKNSPKKQNYYLNSNYNHRQYQQYQNHNTQYDKQQRRMNEQSSYDDYHQNKHAITNSISGSYPSKTLRTQNSKQKVQHLLRNREQQQNNIHKLKAKYSKSNDSNQPQSKISSSKVGMKKQQIYSGTNNQLHSKKPLKVQKRLPQSKSPHRNLRTEYSRQKSSKYYSKNPDSISYDTYTNNINITNSNQYSRNNLYRQNEYSSRNYRPNLNNNYRNQQSQTDRVYEENSASQEYYKMNESSQQYNLQRRLINQSNSNNIGRNNSHRRQNNIESQNTNTYGSQAASTVTKTGARSSSLSMGKFSNPNRMITFYHCQAKKYYQYNDEGYMTDQQLQLRGRVEKGALQLFGRLIKEQNQESQISSGKVKKSKSVQNFTYLNNLKSQVEQQKKQYYEKYGRYEINHPGSIEDSKQKEIKSHIPSQLPPSSSLSKKKFNIKYSTELPQNILTKHQINDDSYHDRQERKREQHKKQMNQNARASIVAKNNKKKSQLSIQKISEGSQLIALDSSHKITPNKHLNVQQPQGISRIVGLTSDQMIYSQKKMDDPSSRSNAGSENKSHLKLSSKPEHSHLESKLSSNSKSQAQNKKSIKYSEKIQPNSSFKNSETVSIKKSTQKSSVSHQNIEGISKLKSEDLAFDMINSKLKEAKPIESKSKISEKHSDSNASKSLRLHTNTRKVKVEPNDQKQSIRPSQIDSSPGSSQNQFLKKQSSHSIKSSHLGLAKERFSKKSSKKSSNSGSFIESTLKKSNDKWVRDDNNKISQENSKQSITMSMKKSKQAVMTYQATSGYNLQIDSKKKIQPSMNKLSLQSQVLNLQSKMGVNSLQQPPQLADNQIDSPSSLKENKYLKLNHQAIKQQSNVNSKMTQQKQKSMQRSSLKSYNASEKISNYSKSQQSKKQKDRKSSLSNHNSKRQGSQLSHKVSFKKSSENSNNPSHASSKISNISAKSSEHSKESKNKKKLQESQKRKDLIQPPPSLYHQKQLSQQNSHSQNMHSNQFTSQTQSQQYLSSNRGIFANLYDKAHQLIEIEEDLHEKRKERQQPDLMDSIFQDRLSKIEAHISMLRQILDIAITATDIYSEDSLWVLKSCFLSLKKYYLQRVKLVDSLKTGKKSCFKIAQNQLFEQDLKQLLSDPQIQQLATDMQYCNELTLKAIEQFWQQLRSLKGIDENQFNLRLFDDRLELGILLQQYQNQIIGLRQKNNDEEQDIEDDTEDIIKQRIFKLMQTGFLMSELAGKRIKEFQQQIDVEDEYEEYLNENWTHFERIVKTFI